MYPGFYFGIAEQLQKIQKLPPDATVKASDIRTFLEMVLETFESQRQKIETLEKRVKQLEET